MEGKDAEKSKKEMKIILDPRDIGIRVKKVLKIRTGVVVEVETKEEVEKVKQSEKLKSGVIKVESGRQKKPVVMIYG